MDQRLKEVIDQSENIVFFGGAGVSTESGIPDFRSESGLYHAQQQYGYSPEQMLSRSFYEQNPKMFFKYYKENLIHLDAEPNDAHRTLARLEEEGKMKAVVTQNIDGLHQKAGSVKSMSFMEAFCVIIVRSAENSTMQNTSWTNPTVETVFLTAIAAAQ